jgi:hypothetical protein
MILAVQMSEMSPKEFLIMGIFFLVVAFVDFAVVIFWPRYLKGFSWLNNSGGTPMSRFGGASWGVAFCASGLWMVLYGYFSVLSSFEADMILLVGLIQLVVAWFYDTLLQKL